MMSPKGISRFLQCYCCEPKDFSLLSGQPNAKTTVQMLVDTNTNENAAKTRRENEATRRRLALAGLGRPSTAKRTPQRLTVGGGGSRSISYGDENVRTTFMFPGRKCCDGTCDECGIFKRFYEGCQSVWKVKGSSGNAVGIRVKVVSKFKRSGQFSNEFENVDMTFEEFQKYYLDIAIKFLLHHYIHVMGGQSIRHFKVNPPADALILEQDFAAIHSHHSQHQENQVIPHRTQILVAIARFYCRPTPRDKRLSPAAVSASLHAGEDPFSSPTPPVTPCIEPRNIVVSMDDGADTEKKLHSVTFYFCANNDSNVKDDSHLVYTCNNWILDWIEEYIDTKFSHIVIPTDGCAKEFKSRKSALHGKKLRELRELDSVTQVQYATATGKGQADGEGYVPKALHNGLELGDTERAVDTRQFVQLLWKYDAQFQPDPPAHGTPGRKIDTIDQRVAVLVLDESDNPSPQDRENKGILIYDASKGIDAVEQPGIMSRYCMQSVKPLAASSSAGPQDPKTGTTNVRFLFCSCPFCTSADHGGLEACPFEEDMGEWKTVPCYEVEPKPPKPVLVRLPLYKSFLFGDGSLPDLSMEDVPIIVGARGGRLVIVVGLPTTLDSATRRQVNNVEFKYKANDVVLDVCPLTRIDPESPEAPEDIPANCILFVRDSTYKKPFMLKLTQVVLPDLDDLQTQGKSRLDCLDIGLLPSPHVGAPQIFVVKSSILEDLRAVEESHILLGD